MSFAGSSVKVVLLGDTGVGKSSLALRFAKNTFRHYCEATIGASFMSKTVDVAHEAEQDLEAENPTDLKEPKTPSKKVEFKIWDTAGQEKYWSLAPMYYRGAGAAILVFDLCNRSTFVTLQKWVDEINEKGPTGIVLVICGNKSDLAAHRQVQIDEGLAFADKVKAFYIEVSARDDKNVHALFAAVAKRVSREDDCDEMRRAEDGHTGVVNLNLRTKRRPAACC